MASLTLSFYIGNSTIYYKYLVLRLILFTSKGIIILIKKTLILLQEFQYGTQLSRLFYVSIITNTTGHNKSTDRGIV